MRLYILIAVLSAGALSIAVAQDAALINWVLFPETVQTAKKQYDERVAEAKERCEKAVAEASEPLVKALTTAQQQAMQVDNLDLAIALRDAKDAVEVGSVDASRSVVRKLMIGKWKLVEVTVNRNHFIVFKEGGSFGLLGMQGEEVNSGTWQVTDKGVEVLCPNDMMTSARGAKYWYFLPHPVNPRLTVGDGWCGHRAIRVQKVR